MRISPQSGLTLIELMIVVAIVAILVAVAVPMFMRSVRRAKASEVPAVFTEFQLREQQYYNENNTYKPTGADENDPYPAVPAGADTPTALVLPTTWQDLRIQLDKTSLYCTYVAVTGDANDASNIGAAATGFGMTAAPEKDWYYLLAECDWDNDNAVNSTYFTSSEIDRIATQNEGR